MGKTSEDNSKAKPAIDVLAQFIDPVVEQNYRQHYLNKAKKHLVFAIFLFMIPSVLFMYSDYLIFKSDGMFHLLIIARVCFLIISFGVLLFMKRIKSYYVFDVVALCWWLLLVALVLFVNSTRPSDYIQHAIVDIMVVVAIYVLVQNRLATQIIPALVFSIGNVTYIMVGKTGLIPITVNVLLISFVMANILGIFIAYRLHATRRVQFATLEEEKRLRKELEKAMTELKVLRGIFPICCNCKRIRDDSGFWEQVDVYISQHSEIDFSHSLCPECFKQLYPDFADSDNE